MLSVQQQPHRFDRLLPAASRSALTFDKVLPPCPKQSGNETTTILVGPKKRRFRVNSQLLCEISPFFRERLEDPFHTETIYLWLPSESASMFALFVEWVHSPYNFRSFLSNTISVAVNRRDSAALEDFHWAIIHLHLFAADLSLFLLQDMAMDAIQDLYFKCKWHVSPQLITYLYTECEDLPSCRLRRWATASVAFAISCESDRNMDQWAGRDPSRFRKPFETLPEFSKDYSQHSQTMDEEGYDMCAKNPQLRIMFCDTRHGQKLNRQHAFGFPECAFHSHCAALIETAPCPNSPTRTRTSATSSTSSSCKGMEAQDMPRPKWSLNKRWNASLFSRNTDDLDKKKAYSITQSIARTFWGRGA